jgi:hypothetical protein
MQPVSQSYENIHSRTYGHDQSEQLSASGISTEVLLPGQFTSTTNPELLHGLLTSSSDKFSPSAGFGNSSAGSSVSLPLNVALQPGIAIYPQTLYSGQGSYSGLPSSPVGNTTIPFTASSIALSGSIWAATFMRISVPDVSWLPASVLGSCHCLTCNLFAGMFREWHLLCFWDMSMSKRIHRCIL